MRGLKTWAIRFTARTPMSDLSEQYEFPGMPVGSPTEEQQLAAEIKKYQEALNEHGVLVAPAVGARLLKVSTQRVCQLLDAGKLTRLVLLGQNWVPLTQLQHRLTAPKETGGKPQNLRGGRPKSAA